MTYPTFAGSARAYHRGRDTAALPLTRAPILALLLTLAPAAASAQLANTVPTALGMGDNYTALARGYSAVAWNPAGLAMAGGPSASATIGAMRVLGGLGPVTLGDLKTWQGEIVPADVRQRWIADINRDGGQKGAAGFDFTIAAFQAGRFGAQVSTSGRTINDIAPGMAELILMGNVDADGNLRDVALGGSDIDAQVYSTGALSFGIPLMVQEGAGRLSLGITAKYTIGHVLGVTNESVGQATAEPAGLRLSFPIAYTPVTYGGTKYKIRAGSGFGIDVGAGYQRGRFSLGAVAQNLFNSFEWDQSLLRYRPLEIVFSDDEIDTDIDWEPLTSAPANLRALVDASTFNPTFALGVAVAAMPRVTLAADARFGSTEGMATRPPNHIGAGVEARPVRWLPLQAGAAWVSLGDERSGLQYGGGLGLQLGTFLISASAMRRDVGLGEENMLMVSLLSHTF
ncbi:hypothetical protein BH23GEM9_BH23GEM9_29870 [soil metagenome]